MPRAKTKKTATTAEWGGGLGSNCMSLCTGEEWQDYLAKYMKIRGTDSEIAAARRKLFERFLEKKAPAELEHLDSHYAGLQWHFRRQAQKKAKQLQKAGTKDTSTNAEDREDVHFPDGQLEMNVIDGTASADDLFQVQSEQRHAMRQVQSEAVEQVPLSETPPQGFKQQKSKAWKRRRCSSGSGTSRRSLADKLYDEVARYEVALGETKHKLKESKARVLELEESLAAIADAKGQPDGSAHAALIAQHDEQAQYCKRLEAIVETQQEEIAHVEVLKENLDNAKGEVKKEKEGRVADREKYDTEVQMINDQKEDLSTQVSSLQKAAEDAERALQESKAAERTMKDQVMRNMVDTIINVARVALATECSADHRRDTVCLYLQGLVHAEQSVLPIFRERQDSCGPVIQEIMMLAAVHSREGV